MSHPRVDGQGMVEYGLILALVALAAAAGFILFGDTLASEHDSIFTSVINWF